MAVSVSVAGSENSGGNNDTIAREVTGQGSATRMSFLGCKLDRGASEELGVHVSFTAEKAD